MFIALVNFFKVMLPTKCQGQGLSMSLVTLAINNETISNFLNKMSLSNVGVVLKLEFVSEVFSIFANISAQG